MIKRILLSLILWGGVVLSSFSHDFTATNQGKTIYYTITDAEKKEVAVAPNGASNNSYEGDIVIPEKVINPNDGLEYTVTSIAASAFKRSYEGATTGRVTSVELPETITKIGANAFKYGSTYLTEINIPDAVTEIGELAFDACKGLTSITLSSNLTTLGQKAFNVCTAITVINYNAESLADFVNNKGPFYGCTADITLNIGNDVTTIPAYAFQGANITGTVTIPDNVKTINASAFQDITSINKLIIGSDITTFGMYVFNGCTGITEIISKPTTVPTSGYGLFNSVTTTIPVYIPAGSVSSYSGNSRWSSFTNFKEFSELTEHIDNYGTMVVEVDALLLTGAGAITIKNGGIVTSPNILGATPENLIIEDGGRLITHNAVQATVQKNITAASNWGTGTTYTPNNWYFIASPVDDAAFPTGSYDNQDIYQLDWTNNQWLNLQYSGNSELLSAGFQRGTGYLYASKEGNTISVAGEIQPLSNDNNATVTLAVDGWNLIGNPLTCKVTVDKAFSELNGGSAVTNQTSGSTINPFQGIAVYGDAGTTVTFTKAAAQNAVAPSNSNSLQMTLSQTVATRGAASSKVVDNAIVNFNGGSDMPKFKMLEGNANIFIPQNGEDYAIASSNHQGEMPLNFKANEVGTYTISFSGEVNGAYLIDMIDEQEVNLSANPSYTFIGSPTDRSERFKIVFRNTSNDIFAYQNGCDIIVSGEGELQIFDVMGRIVAKQYVSGVETINVKANGVYIFRLNGMTQKIVVK